MSDPNPKCSPRPIAELVAEPDFPESAVGEKVDIKGFAGVVMGVVNNSIKVRSAEGNTVSYNFHALRRLYGPRVEPDPAPEALEALPVPAPQAKTRVILEPNFKAPLVPIETLADKADFPACTLGSFVDFHGFSGVVVELFGHSLKVRSREGVTRSYNAEGLRRIYAKSGVPMQRSRSAPPRAGA
jgi:hypothetical protein